MGYFENITVLPLLHCVFWKIWCKKFGKRWRATWNTL